MALVHGPPGTGKTTVLEVTIDQITEKYLEFPDPKIVFVTWDDSKGLKDIFTKKFEGIRKGNDKAQRWWEKKEDWKTYSVQEKEENVFLSF